MERQIAKEIRDVHFLIKKSLSQTLNAQFHLNHSQLLVMFYLIKNKDKKICQKDLEKETNLKKASITDTLDALEEMGAIRRVPDEKDKRKKLIVLTSGYLREEKKVEALITKKEEELRKGLSEKEIETLFTIIDKLKKNIEVQEDETNI